MKRSEQGRAETVQISEVRSTLSSRTFAPETQNAVGLQPPSPRGDDEDEEVGSAAHLSPMATMSRLSHPPRLRCGRE